jgi:GntR family transcriptional repressor for pyruvate dehydrogenase complex
MSIIDDESFISVKNIRTSDIIVKEIWNLILSGKLKPGDKLPSERDLVSRFEVSKVTVREALHKLETYGHIEKKRGQKGGSIVLNIIPEQGIIILLNYLKVNNISVEQLIQTRALIEPLMARLAAQNATDDDIANLKKLLEQHEKDYYESGSSKRGWQFYLLLSRITKNEFFIVFEELLIRCLLDMEFSIGVSSLKKIDDQKDYNKATFEGRRKVANAIISKNPGLAEFEMKNLRRVWEEIITRNRQDQ